MPGLDWGYVRGVGSPGFSVCLASEERKPTLGDAAGPDHPTCLMLQGLEPADNVHYVKLDPTALCLYGDWPMLARMGCWSDLPFWGLVGRVVVLEVREYRGQWLLTFA